MRYMYALALLFLCVSLSAKTKTSPTWHTGTLLNSWIEKDTRLSADNEGIHERRNDQAYYQIDDGDKYVYVARRSMTGLRDKPLPVTVNAPIKFSIDGDNMLLLDEKGEQHKLSIEKKTLRNPTP